MWMGAVWGPVQLVLSQHIWPRQHRTDVKTPNASSSNTNYLHIHFALPPTGASAACHELYLKGVLLQGGRRKGCNWVHFSPSGFNKYLLMNSKAAIRCLREFSHWVGCLSLQSNKLSGSSHQPVNSKANWFAKQSQMTAVEHVPSSGAISVPELCLSE